MSNDQWELAALDKKPFEVYYGKEEDIQGSTGKAREREDSRACHGLNQLAPRYALDPPLVGSHPEGFSLPVLYSSPEIYSHVSRRRHCLILKENHEGIAHRHGRRGRSHRHHRAGQTLVEEDGAGRLRHHPPQGSQHQSERFQEVPGRTVGRARQESDCDWRAITTSI